MSGSGKTLIVMKSLLLRQTLKILLDVVGDLLERMLISFEILCPIVHRCQLVHRVPLNTPCSCVAVAQKTSAIGARASRLGYLAEHTQAAMPVLRLKLSMSLLELSSTQSLEPFLFQFLVHLSVLLGVISVAEPIPHGLEGGLLEDDPLRSRNAVLRIRLDHADGEVLRG